MRDAKIALCFAVAWAACGGDDSKLERTGMDASVDASSQLMDASEVAPDSARDDAGPRARKRVQIAFEAKVGSEPFACDRTYDNVGSPGARVQPVDLRLFVQDVALIRTRDGQEVAVELDAREPYQRTDVTLLDFEDNRGSCVRVGGNAGTNTVVTGWVPEDEYRGIAFSNGVPEAENHKNPIDLTPPLTSGPLHWNWNNGFIFFDAHLQEFVEPSDASLPPADASVTGSALVHIGSSLCAPSGCGKSNRNRIVLADFDVDANRVVLDVAAVFRDIDLGETTTCHAVGVGCAGFMGPLGIDLDTGAPSTTQTIYHVE